VESPSRSQPSDFTSPLFGPGLAVLARMRASWLIVLAFGACASDDLVDDPDDDAWLDGKADTASAVDIKSTHLDVNLAGDTAKATLELENNGNVALEASGLTVTKVTDDRGNRKFKIVDGTLRVSNVRGSLAIEYGFTLHTNADGLLAGGSTRSRATRPGARARPHGSPRDRAWRRPRSAGSPADRARVPLRSPL